MTKIIVIASLWHNVILCHQLNLLLMKPSWLILIMYITNLSAFGQNIHNEVSNKPKYPNTASLFVGSTIIHPSGFNLPTIGLEFIHEVNHYVGFGIMGEVEVGSHIIQVNRYNGIKTEVERHSAALLIPSVFLNVYKELIISVGYGVEFEKTKNLGLFKTSIEYKLYLQNDRFIILPTLSWDYTTHFQGWVYGVNFGYNF